MKKIILGKENQSDPGQSEAPTMEKVILRKEAQINPVQSEVLALISVIRPILLGLLYSSRREYVSEVGGHQNMKLKMLPAIHTPGDGDVGICFEWAIHDAIKRGDPSIISRIETSLKKCGIEGDAITSILFGAEKFGALQIIDSANSVLTDDSRLLSGARAQPIKLKNHLRRLVKSYRGQTIQPYSSIAGLWKADLFLGETHMDRWVGSSVKINPKDLEAAPGLRIGIVPMSQGKSDKVSFDKQKNLIVCPVPYDQSFMEIFYTGWRVVQQFIAARGGMPKEVALPNPPERQAAKELIDRLDFPIIEVVDALLAQSQVNLLESTQTETEANLIIDDNNKEEASEKINTIITPVPQTVD